MDRALEGFKLANNRPVHGCPQMPPGSREPADGSAGPGPTYTGHVTDTDTALVYMGARYYDPAIGRAISIDPEPVDPFTGGNFNRYWYANNNPYRFTDPDGRAVVVYPLLVFLAKEAASEGVEQVTGVPMPTVKNAGKLVVRQAINQGRKEAAEATLRKVPNPYGKQGGLPHQGKVAEVASDVESRGLKAVQELKVDTPGGEKGARFIDVAGVDPKSGKAVEFHQVGRSKVDGTGVAGEQRAINDVSAAKPDVPIKFHPYDK